MEQDFYQFYIIDAVQRKDVDRLVGIWYETSLMKDEGEGYHQLINSMIPLLAKWYHIEYVVDPDDENAFRKFVKLYDKRDFEMRCQDTGLNKCLAYYAKTGSRDGIRFAMEKGATDWYGALLGATESGNMKLIEFFWTLLNRVPPKSIALFAYPSYEGQEQRNLLQKTVSLAILAVDNGHIEAFEFFLKIIGDQSRRDELVRHCLRDAVQLNNLATVENFVNTYHRLRVDIDSAMANIVLSDNRGAIVFVLDFYPDKVENIFLAVMRTGDPRLLELMLEYGIDFTEEGLNTALYEAVVAHNEELTHLFIEKGATDILNAAIASQKRNFDDRRPIWESDANILRYLTTSLSKEEKRVLEKERALLEEKKRTKAQEERREQDMLARAAERRLRHPVRGSFNGRGRGRTPPVRPTRSTAKATINASDL